MAALYTLFSEDDEHHEFDEIEDLCHFLLHHQKDNGEIHLLDGFKIKYDVRTGDVTLHIINTKPYITYIFQPESLHHLYVRIEPIMLLMRHRSKMELIHKLQDLEDPGILKLIKDKNIINPDTGRIDPIKLKEERLDETLSHIYYFVTPPQLKEKKIFYWLFENNKEQYLAVHHAIYQAFNQFEANGKKIMHISSMDDVTNLLELFLKHAPPETKNKFKP